MDGVREFIQQESGFEPGTGYEVSFADMGVTQKTLDKSRGKVGFKTSLTEFFKSAKRRAKRENPIAPNQADIVVWVLYDRFQFGAGTVVPNNFKFFTSPIGQNGKSKVDTNMEQVQRLADPLWYNTTGLGFYFSPLNTPQDINQFMATEYCEFWVGQKTYIEGPIQLFPGGTGISGTASGASAPFSAFSNGVPRIDNVFDLRLPAGIHLGNDTNNVPIVTDGLIGVTILQGQQFRVEMKADTGGASLLPPTGGTGPFPTGTGLTVMCYLYGILSRGVQ